MHACRGKRRNSWSKRKPRAIAAWLDLAWLLLAIVNGWMDGWIDRSTYVRMCNACMRTRRIRLCGKFCVYNCGCFCCIGGTCFALNGSSRSSSENWPIFKEILPCYWTDNPACKAKEDFFGDKHKKTLSISAGFEPVIAVKHVTCTHHCS